MKTTIDLHRDRVETFPATGEQCELPMAEPVRCAVASHSEQRREPPHCPGFGLWKYPTGGFEYQERLRGEWDEHQVPKA